MQSCISSSMFIQNCFPRMIQKLQLCNKWFNFFPPFHSKFRWLSFFNAHLRTEILRFHWKKKINTLEFLKPNSNRYTATFEGQVVGKEQISPSGKSNLEEVVKEVGGAYWQYRDGEDVQRRSYRNQHSFITCTSEVENVIVTIQIPSCRWHFLPAWRIQQWRLKQIVTFAFQLVSVTKWKNCNEQH